MARALSRQTSEAVVEVKGRYPTGLAALVPSLHLVQAQLGYVSPDAELDVAELLDVPPTRVHEAVTFYSMFHQQPVGRHVVKICRNLACELRGGKRLLERAEKTLGIKVGETSADGRVTLEHKECLASCGTGPALWCDDQLVENLDLDKLDAFLNSLH